jgi:adenylyltransferase/sulfurtransferase
VQVRAPAGTRLDLSELEARLLPLGAVRRNPYLLCFAAPEGELVVFEDGRAIVKGTDDAARARALYARYVGS